MLVRFVDACVVSGTPRAIGDVADVSEHDAQQLIQMGRASEAAAPAPAPGPAPAPAPAPPRRSTKPARKED